VPVAEGRLSSIVTLRSNLSRKWKSLIINSLKFALFCVINCIHYNVTLHIHISCAIVNPWSPLSIYLIRQMFLLLDYKSPLPVSNFLSINYNAIYKSSFSQTEWLYNTVYVCYDFFYNVNKSKFARMTSKHFYCKYCTLSHHVVKLKKFWFIMHKNEKAQVIFNQ